MSDAPQTEKKGFIERLSDLLKSIALLVTAIIGLFAIVPQLREQVRELYCSIKSCSDNPTSNVDQEVTQKPDVRADPAVPNGSVSRNEGTAPSMQAPSSERKTPTQPQSITPKPTIRKFSEQYPGFCWGSPMYVKKGSDEWKINTYRITINAKETKIKFFIASARSLQGIDLRLVPAGATEVGNMLNSPKVVSKIKSWDFKTPDGQFVFDCFRDGHPPAFGYDIDVYIPESISSGSYEIWKYWIGADGWTATTPNQLLIDRR